MPASLLKYRSTLLAIIIVFVLTACSAGFLSVPTPSPAPTYTFVPTATETPVPMAVIVNGDGIPVPEFEAELARYQQALASLGKTTSLEVARQAVANDMVDILLLEQAASAAGFVVDEATLQTRIDTLAAQMGGAEALSAWEAAQGYSTVDFRSSLRRQIAAAWMRDQVAASVTKTADQVHVFQILLYNEGDAQQALVSLQAGWNFEDLAASYDSLTKGELGWFPRGYIPSKAIEEAVFALEPGQYSAIIHDEIGYHLLFVVERDPSRPLSPDALLTLQEKTVQSWLTQKRIESTILIAP
jgi:peptidyl-prolyl cis-trans isomerase C